MEVFKKMSNKSIRIKCAKCKDIITARYENDFDVCSCESIYVCKTENLLGYNPKNPNILIFKKGKWVHSNTQESEIKNDETVE